MGLVTAAAATAGATSKSFLGIHQTAGSAEAAAGTADTAPAEVVRSVAPVADLMVAPEPAAATGGGNGDQTPDAPSEAPNVSSEAVSETSSQP